MPHEHGPEEGRRRGDAESVGSARPKTGHSAVSETWVASRIAKSGVVKREALPALQHTIGNRRVQRLIALQREPNQLDEKDIDPELLKDLDSRMQMSGEGEPNQLDEKDIDPELLKDLDSRMQMTGEDTGAGLDATPGGEPGGTYGGSSGQRQARGVERGKGSKGGGIGQVLGKVGRGIGRFFKGTVDAYKPGGTHSQLTDENRTLNKAKKALAKGQVSEAQGLVGKRIYQKATGKRRLQARLLSPILFARYEAQRAKLAKIRKQISEAG